MVPRVSQCHPWYIIKWLAYRWRWYTKLTHSYFPYLAAPLFSTVTGPQRHWIFSLIGAAITYQGNLNVDQTKSKRIHAWDKWCKFLRSISLRRDVFLDGFSRWQRQLVLVTFSEDARQAAFSGTKEETGCGNSQRYRCIPILVLQGSFKRLTKKRPRWVIVIIVETDLQGIRKWRSRHEKIKGVTYNLPIKSTRPLPDRIGNSNGRVCLCYIFLRGATLQLHQDVENRINQNNKDHHTWKHPLLQEEEYFTTWSSHRKFILGQYPFWVP